MCDQLPSQWGRSGTLAAYLIAKALEKTGTKLTLQLIIEIIENLRKNRNYQMVQTSVQWKLLIDALLPSYPF